MSEEKKPKPKKEKKPLIHERIIQIMDEVPAIGKDAQNKEQKFMYRSIDAVISVLHELLAKYKIYITPKIQECKHELIDRPKGGKQVYVFMQVVYELTCADDLSTITVGPLPAESTDYSDKASYKALSLSLKHFLLHLFAIPVLNQYDGDANNLPLGGKDTPAQKMLNGKEAKAPEPNEAEKECLSKIKVVLEESADGKYKIDFEALKKWIYGNSHGKYPTDDSKIGAIVAWIEGSKEFKKITKDVA